MRTLDLIVQKRNGQPLSAAEIGFLVQGYTRGEIPEYQISALLMAIYFQGMDADETASLTREMIASGDKYTLPGLEGPFVDKHSTGGVGDKVSLILAPIAAAMGIRVPMMSGRSLGHTGGTLDKLEAIPGYSTQMDEARFVEIIRECGFAMTGQSKDIVPADRLLYALRDVTGTVESISLITSSILSKKFAEGADALVFDVKFGSGAFMKTISDARTLAGSLQRTGAALGRKIVCVLSDMNQVLGTMVGNFLEAEESYNCLLPESKLWQCVVREDGSQQFSGPCGRLMELTLRLAAWMGVCAGLFSSVDQAFAAALQVCRDGQALARFEKNIQLQGGDPAQFKDRLGTWRAPVYGELIASSDGYIASVEAYRVGMAAVYLGAGRSKTGDKVYPDVGVELLLSPGSRVKKGDVVLRFWARDKASAKSAKAELEGAVSIEAKEPSINPIVAEEIPAL